MARPDLPPPPHLDSGWYPDPTSRYEARFWDGRKWTSHISHFGATGVDPLRRVRIEDRLGLGILWMLRLVATVLVLGGLTYAGWRLWPRPDARSLASDRTTAADAVLQPGDLGPDWSEGVADQLGPLTSTLPEAGCDAVAEAHEALRLEPGDQSGLVSDDGRSRVASAVRIAEDDNAAAAYVAALDQADAQECLALVLPAAAVGIAPAAAAEMEIDDLAVRRMSSPSVGDTAVWWRLEGTIQGELLAVPVNIDLVVFQVDRAIAEMTFVGIGEPPEPGVQRAALQAVADRLEADPSADESDDPLGADGEPGSDVADPEAGDTPAADEDG